MRFFQSAVKFAKPVSVLAAWTGGCATLGHKLAEENERDLQMQEAVFREKGVATQRVQVADQYPSVTSYYMTTGYHTEVRPVDAASSPSVK
ncbi:MAG: hypothetical protein P1U39_02060 [Legionellaceae bacterium]|nr:hypothetical protein [Legionellaceae bacterium]